LTRFREGQAVRLFIVSVLGLLTFLPTWDEPYAEDDYLFLEAITRPGAPPPHSYFWREGVMDHHYRPLSDPLFFALVHGIFGSGPVGYHVFLTAFHVLAAWFLYSLGRRLGAGSTGAAMAALLFVTRDSLFPSHIWASGVSDVGSAMFALASLAAHARSLEVGGVRYRVLAAALTLLAVLTKETAVVLVVLHLLLAAYFATCRPESAFARASAPSRRRLTAALVRAIGPFILVAVPIAVAQVTSAEFEEAYGKRLYAMAVGGHTIERLPMYLVWSLAAVKEIFDGAIARVAASGVVYGGIVLLLVAAARAGGRRTPRRAPPASTGVGRDGTIGDSAGARSARRVLVGGIAALAFVAAISPALLAPKRLLTNYLAIAGAVPCLLVGSAAAAAFRSRGPIRSVGIGLGLGLLLLGPFLVGAKDRGRLQPGGWVRLDRSRALAHVANAVAGSLVPRPEPRARFLIFGATEYDLPVLGDPRGEGFGVQQVLASALRVRYGRSDLETLSLPPIDRSPPEVFGLVFGLMRDRTRETYVLATALRSHAREPQIRDLTARTRAASGPGGSPRMLQEALQEAFRVEKPAEADD
jgi:hypothetical protein